MKLDEIITQEDFLGDFKDFADRIQPKMKNFADQIKPHMEKGAKEFKQYFDQEFHNKKEPKKPNKDNMLTTDVNDELGKQLPNNYYHDTYDSDIKSTPSMGGYKQTKNTKKGTYTDHYKDRGLSTQSTYDKSGKKLHKHETLALGDKSHIKSTFYPEDKSQEVESLQRLAGITPTLNEVDDTRSLMAVVSDLRNISSEYINGNKLNVPDDVGGFVKQTVEGNNRKLLTQFGIPDDEVGDKIVDYILWSTNEG